jgi:hypothetical protein
LSDPGCNLASETEGGDALRTAGETPALLYFSLPPGFAGGTAEAAVSTCFEEPSDFKT